MKNKAKVLQKLINSNCDFDLDEMLEEYAYEHDPICSPKDKQNYVGIEIECFSFLEKYEVMGLLLAYDLEKYVDIGEDCSIEAPDNKEPYELGILIPEKQLTPILKTLGKFLKEGNFGTNYSCGLHIHLDMRYRNVEKCYSKLLKFQDVLFGIVNSNRWDNEYCQWSDSNHKFNRGAINYLSYSKHKTLEVRLHHGCVNVTKIESWIKLLLKAIGTKEITQVKSKADAVKWAGKDTKIKSYIKRNFKTEWFDNRNKVINHEFDGFDDDEYF